MSAVQEEEKKNRKNEWRCVQLALYTYMTAMIC